MKKLIVIGLSFVAFLIVFFLQTTFAADSTPSADIKAKLEQFKKEIASKAAELKKEVDHKLKDKAYTGKVKTKSEQSLTVAANSGPKIISINQDTVFESKVPKKTKISAKTIAEEDYIAALGDIDETGVMIAKKIILLPKLPNSGEKTFLWGQIIALSDKLATLKNRDLKSTAVSLPDNTNIKLNDFVILTGLKNKNDIFQAEFVYIISQKGFIKPKKAATPSASFKTSPGVR